VDSVHLPNVFPTIHGQNTHLYVSERSTTNAVTFRKLALTANKSYDGDGLATEVALKLNTGTTLTANSYTCTFSTSTGRLTISNSTGAPSTFSIWPEGYLEKTTWNPANQATGGAYIKADHCYDVLGFAGTEAITGAQSSVTGGHVNVQPYHTLFLHSNLGLQGDALGPDNSQSIIRKIVLDSGVGTMINDFHSLPYDYVTVQPTQIRSLHFRLSDWRGRTVDLLHTGFSFSLLFVPEEEF